MGKSCSGEDEDDEGDGEEETLSFQVSFISFLIGWWTESVMDVRPIGFHALTSIFSLFENEIACYLLRNIFPFLFLFCGFECTYTEHGISWTLQIADLTCYNLSTFLS